MMIFGEQLATLAPAMNELEVQRLRAGYENWTYTERQELLLLSVSVREACARGCHCLKVCTRIFRVKQSSLASHTAILGYHSQRHCHNLCWQHWQLRTRDWICMPPARTPVSPGSRDCNLCLERHRKYRHFDDT